MYSVSPYGAMIADKIRTDGYARALKQSITPNSVVVDIGTGTGVFALLACRFGARRVYAIEPSDAIQVGRECAAANGCADRIQWIQDISTRVTLPELADVIVSDLRGCLPLYEHHLTAIADARLRLLAPGGVMIPQEDRLWLCPVEAPDSYSAYTVPWLENPFHFDLSAGYRRAINSWGKGRVPRERFLSPPVRWATLDYRPVESPDVSAKVTCVANRGGTAHGMSLWFEAKLADGIHFSTAPDLPELVYGSAFLPWIEPVALTAGDTMTITIDANLVGNQYIWRWHTEVLDQCDPNSVKARFGQSTFFGIPLSPTQMRKRAAGFRPALNEDGRIVRRVLDLMAVNMVLEDIAAQLLNEFPGQFPRHADALARVGQLSVKYSESVPKTENLLSEADELDMTICVLALPLGWWTAVFVVAGFSKFRDLSRTEQSVIALGRRQPVAARRAHLFGRALIGRGTYHHVIGRSPRISLLRDCRSKLHPWAPTILSDFFLRQAGSRHFKRLKAVADAVRFVRGSTPVEPGDWLSSGAQHAFVCDEIDAEFKDASFDLIRFADSPMGERAL